MIPMNNPIMAMINMARSGGNPMALIQQMAGSNPQVAQMMNMVRGKNPQQLKSMAENMAKERGTSLEAVTQQLGLNMPK